MTKLAAKEIAGLDPYKFMAVIGKRVIHPGGRASTESLLRRAAISESSRVLDVGCGVATTAVEIAKRHGARVTAVDIAPLMLERAEANVREAGVAHLVTVEPGDILSLQFVDDRFDVVIAEAVTISSTQGVPPPSWPESRSQPAACWPPSSSGGSRQPPRQGRSSWARFVPGSSSTRSRTGCSFTRPLGSRILRPRRARALVMTPHGFLADEGLTRSLAIMGRVAGRPAHVREMAGLMRRITPTVPYFGYIVVAATKPG